jgi:hypothetical protein
MKPTEFLREHEFIAQDAHEMHQDHQHQMLREECYHIASNAIALYKLMGALDSNKPLDAWAAEYISLANDHIRSVKEWLEVEEMESEGVELPAFDTALAEAKFKQTVAEINPHNYDSDEDYYNDLYGHDDEDDDYDRNEPDVDHGDDESHYEKHLRVNRLESRRTVKENATGGATGASSVAVTIETLGDKGAFSKKDVNKKLSGYSNVLTRGKNNVKVKGAY